MRVLIAAAALVAVGLGARTEWDGGHAEAGLSVPVGLAPVVGLVQSPLGGGEDADMARAFLDAATGANPMMCSLAVRGIANSWGGDGSMTTVVGFGMPDPTERALLEWAMERRLDADAAGPLADALEHSDDCRRLTAAALFARIEESVALPVLEPLARSGADPTRIAALRALGHVEAPSSLSVLSAALEDASAAVRRVAAWSIGEGEAPGALRALTTALGDSDHGVRGNAAWAFGRIEHRDAIPSLSDVLEGDPEATVRVNAAWAMGQIEHPDAVPALIRALRDDADPLVRKAAAWALGQMS